MQRTMVIIIQVLSRSKRRALEIERIIGVRPTKTSCVSLYLCTCPLKIPHLCHSKFIKRNCNVQSKDEAHL